MRFFGWTLARTLAPQEIVRPRASQGPQLAPAIEERLNQLENTVERLQLDQSERQLSVLTAVEKVMHQLRAREAKRAREAPAEENGDTPELPLMAQQDQPVFSYPRVDTSALAHRFRRF